MKNSSRNFLVELEEILDSQFDNLVYLYVSLVEAMVQVIFLCRILMMMRMRMTSSGL